MTPTDWEPSSAAYVSAYEAIRQVSQCDSGTSTACAHSASTREKHSARAGRLTV